MSYNDITSVIFLQQSQDTFIALFFDFSERTKSKKKQWDIQTLMLGAGVKLILFLPVLAVLTGKAISLSLTSLLITSLGFLYKNQLDSFAKRSNSI